MSEDERVELSGWHAADPSLYFVRTTEWGDTVERLADDLRAVCACLLEADAGSTAIVRMPNKPEETPIEELKENVKCL